MAKISKQKIKLHEKACELLEQDEISTNDGDFIYENWLPAYNNNVGWIASFFTPIEMTYEFAMYANHSGRIVDIAAGIGGLSRAIIDRAKNSGDSTLPEITCIERNFEFVEVGKKLVPEAKWIQGDIFDEEVWNQIGDIDFAISNPPFGQIKQEKPDWIKYTGVADLMTVAVAMQKVDTGAFILPQGSLPFKYSGEHYYSKQKPKVFEKFHKVFPDVEFYCSSTDTSVYEDQWVDVKPKVEIVNVERVA